MSKDFHYHMDTALAHGLRDLLKRLEERIGLNKPVNVYLAGGMAVHLYTGSRTTCDVDAEFGSKVYIPQDLAVQVVLEDGRTEEVYLDTNYNSTFALMHEDYLEKSIPVELGLAHFRLHVLSPIDLAISKISRFADNDKQDIAALVRLGLVGATQIERHAMEAIGGYVGGVAMLLLNVRDAVKLAREVEAELLSRRVSGLASLQTKAGAAYTFWQHAMSALSKAGAPQDVDWPEVEKAAAVESLGKGQSPQEVADVICQYSPGAIELDRKERVRELVGQLGSSAECGPGPVADL